MSEQLLKSFLQSLPSGSDGRCPRMHVQSAIIRILHKCSSLQVNSFVAICIIRKRRFGPDLGVPVWHSAFCAWYDGETKVERFAPSLNPDYVSVESVSWLIMYTRREANRRKSVRAGQKRKRLVIKSQLSQPVFQHLSICDTMKNPDIKL